MIDALLVMGTSSMFYFTGNVPRPLLDQSWERTGGPEIVKQIDGRYLNEEIRFVSGNLAIGAEVLLQQKIILKTEF